MDDAFGISFDDPSTAVSPDGWGGSTSGHEDSGFGIGDLIDPNLESGTGFGIGDLIDPNTAQGPSFEIGDLIDPDMHVPPIDDRVGVPSTIPDLDAAEPVLVPEPLPVPEPTVDPLSVPLPEPLPVPMPEPAPPEPLPAMPIPESEPRPEPEPEPSPDVEAPQDGVAGSPDKIADNWFYQEVDGYCGPSSAAQIISEYTGVDISDPQLLADRSTELGLWYSDGDPSSGMTLSNLEILFEDQGVPCETQTSSIEDLTDKLADGYGVVAMVDSGELWAPDQEIGEDDTPDHFVVVSGIDEARGVVILSDPGSPEGNGKEYPIEQFENAWADSGHSMLVADEPDIDLVDSTPADPTAMAMAPAPAPWAIIDLTQQS